MTLYRYLPFTITLKSPAVITAPGGDPNSSSTLPFIPGTGVRGAVAKSLGDPDCDRDKQQEFNALILGGAVRYLNAYPVVNGRRSVPTPVSLKLKKNLLEERRYDEVIDLSAYDSNEWPEDDMITIGEGFLSIGAARPKLYHPRINSRIHNQRDREKGRAWKDKKGNTHGAIFTFESLEADQSFAGLIQLRGEHNDEMDRLELRIKSLLGKFMLIGRSRRAGYGGMAEVISSSSTQEHEIVGGGSEEFQPLKRAVKAGEKFRLLLTSPCVVRHPYTGQPDPTALMVAIEEQFCHKVSVDRKVWAFENAGGFNKKWRLALSQSPAVSAGSALVLHATQAIALDELTGIMHEGLGERKEEGFGRVLLLETAKAKEIALKKFDSDEPVSPVDGQPPELVNTIEWRILQTQLIRKIEETAGQLAKKHDIDILPTNSLIGRLRLPLRDSDPKDALETLKTWLCHAPADQCDKSKQLKAPAMNQLERCSKYGTDLSSWILSTSEEMCVLEQLDYAVIAQQYYVVSEESAIKAMKKHAVELSVKLIDAVLAAMAIRNKLEEERNGN